MVNGLSPTMAKNRPSCRQKKPGRDEYTSSSLAAMNINRMPLNYRQFAASTMSSFLRPSSSPQRRRSTACSFETSSHLRRDHAMPAVAISSHANDGHANA